MKRTHFFILVLLLGSCQSSAPAEIPSDELQLGSFLRDRLHMVPVAPAREDVRVGDVFLYTENPEGTLGEEEAAFTPLHDVRWTSLGVSESLMAEYTARPELPETPQEYALLPGDRSWQEASAKQALFAGEASSNRLRSVFLPGFSVSRAQLESALPGEVANLVLGERWGDWKAISLRIPTAESYALDMDDVLDLLVDQGPDGSYTLKEEHRDHLRAFPAPEQPTVFLRVVGEVLFARSLQFALSFESDIEDDEVGASQLGITTAEASSGDTLDPAYAAIARAQAINESLRQSGTDTLPDGFFRFVTVSPNFIAARKVWRRPMAIGVKGLTLEVDKETGDVVRMGWMGKPLRQTSAPPELASVPEG